jgi:hypothetical protein
MAMKRLMARITLRQGTPSTATAVAVSLPVASCFGGPQAVDDIWPGGSRHARNEWTPRALGKQPAAHFPSPCSAGYPGRSRNYGYALVFLKPVPERTARSRPHLSEWTVWVRSRKMVGPKGTSHLKLWHGQGDGQAPVTLKLSSNFHLIWRTKLPRARCAAAAPHAPREKPLACSHPIPVGPVGD